MPKTCLGEYQPEGQCLDCVLAFLCIQVAIEADGYYDKLAEERSWWEDYEEVKAGDSEVRHL